MTPFEGQNALVFGVANDHSLAWAIAKMLAAQGARLAIAYGDDRLERRARPLGESVGAALVSRCDVSRDDDIARFMTEAEAALGPRIDLLVHSLAFADSADLAGDFTDTSRGGFGRALDVSVYSLVALTRAVRPKMTGGGSVLTLSYYGAEKVVSGYKVMGPAKAALESTVRYLAAELGPSGIRVNAVSAGAVRTLAAAGIPGFRDLMKGAAEKAPLRRNVTPEEVANAACFLLSRAASAVTGEILHVDAGFSLLGV